MEAYDSNESSSSLSSLHTNKDVNDVDVEDDEDEDDDMDEFAVVSLILDEEHMMEQRPRRGGSYPGRAPNKKRDFIGAAEKLMRQYFQGDNSVYSEEDFKRRFRAQPICLENQQCQYGFQQQYQIRCN